VANVIGKIDCDLGQCDFCTQQWTFSPSTLSCPAASSLTYQPTNYPQIVVRELCFFGLLWCQRFANMNAPLAKCLSPMRSYIGGECSAYLTQAGSCQDLRAGPFGAVWPHEFALHRDGCRHHWASPLATGGVREKLTTVCFSMGTDEHLRESSYITSSPCGPSPQLSCTSSPRKCSLKPGVTALNFDGARNVTYTLQVRCSCLADPAKPPHSELRIEKQPSGFVELQWPTLFSCPHSFTLVAQRDGGAETSSPAERADRSSCGGRMQQSPQVSAFSVTGMKAGVKFTYSVVASVIEIAQRIADTEESTLKADFWVPFDSYATARVVTRDANGVAQRRVEFQARAKAGAMFNGAPKFYSFANVLLNSTRTTDGAYSTVVATSATGDALVRVFWSTDGVSAAAVDAHQLVELRAIPAATEDGRALAYASCPSPCSLSVDLEHGKSKEESVRLSFTDDTAITLRGGVAFYGVDDCFANDIKVRVLNAAGLQLKEEPVSADGRFAIPVQRNVAFNLVFARNSTPDYVYVDTQGRRASPQYAVSPGSSDVAVDLKFTAALRESTAMPNVTVPLAGGLCQLSMFPARLAQVEMLAPSCNGGRPRRFAASIVNDARAFSIAAVPPLRFTEVAPDLSFADAMGPQVLQYLNRSVLGRVLDARVPTVDAATATRVNQTGGPVSLLRDSLVLALPLESDASDFSTYEHATVPTLESALTFAAGAKEWLVQANRSAITLGRNTIVDVSGAATIAMRVRVDGWIGATRATLLSIADVSSTGAAGSGSLELAVSQTSGGSLDLALYLDRQLVGRYSQLQMRRTYHIAVRIVLSQAPTLVVDGVESPLQSSAPATAFRRRLLTECAAAFQYDCVREFTLCAAFNETVPFFSGAVSDVALWSRALPTADIAFIAAAAADGKRLAALLGASEPLPHFIYRAPVEVDIPAETIRYWSPPGSADTGNAAPMSLAELAAGRSLGSTACTTRETGAPQTNIHAVQQNGAVSVLAHSFEEYFDGKRCYLVRGVSRMRSTFTASCLPHDQADDGAMPCEGVMGKNAFGYSYFNALVGDPKLLPRDPARTDGGATRRFADYTFDQMKPYLGEYRFTFEAPQNSASRSLWFHVRGFKGPDFPSVYSLPMNDVPILRLYRPPGDQSQSFLSRSWAKSVQLSFSRENGKEVRVSNELSSRFTAGVEITNCVGGGVGVGLGAVVIGLTMFCIDTKANAFVKAALRTSGTFRDTTSISLAEAFSSDVLTQFQTAIDDRTVGKWGDIVVTVGITVLVTDSYFNTFNASQCLIDQLYSPEWRPGDENVIDSLQVTPRIGVKPIIDDWQTQINVMNRDCDNQLGGPLRAIYPPDFKAKNLTRCTKLDASGGRVPVVDVDEVAKKFLQASAAVLRWSAILRNWEATFCAALKAANTPDYYATADRPACSLVGSNGTEVSQPTVWNLLGDSTVAGGFEQKRAAAQRGNRRRVRRHAQCAGPTVQDDAGAGRRARQAARRLARRRARRAGLCGRQQAMSYTPLREARRRLQAGASQGRRRSSTSPVRR
jgi:hypothetical protein